MSVFKSILILSTGFFIILYAAVSPGLSIPSEKNTRHTDYEWKQVVKPGNGSFQEKWKDGKWPMALVPIIAFENKLWMIGHNKSWSSADGIRWAVHQKTDWGERYGMSYAFYKNKLWMLGGMRTWNDFRNDVWASADGKTWTQVVIKANWQPRRGQHLIVFKNKLWLIGGELSSGSPDQTPSEFLNDVWSSEDGINWIQESVLIPGVPKNNRHVIVFHNKLWMISTIEKKIFNSPDGKNWGLVAEKLPWRERQGNGLLLFNDKLWIFGGIERNDSWFSADGIEWQQLNEHAHWSPRSTYYSIVFNNKLWIFSGKTGREDSWSGDVWTLEQNQKETSSAQIIPHNLLHRILNYQFGPYYFLLQ